MKKILILIVAVTLTACGSQKATKNNTPSVISESSQQTEAEMKEKSRLDTSQSLKSQPTYAKDASGNLTGIVNKDAFMQAPFDTWFNSRITAYEPNQESIEGLKMGLEGVEIRAYMGTWCGDSKREIPRFYHILEAAYFNMDNLTMITVDRSKKKPVDLVANYDVKRVPTFIFYRDGQEIGRYVERPRESLEKDMLNIVTGQPYKHSYDN